MRSETKKRLGVIAVLAGLATALAPVSGAGAADAQARGACRVTAWGYTGYYKCGTDLRAGYIDWDNDGTVDEVFVIAPDRTIWHTWAAAGGWQQMPGNGHADDMLGANTKVPRCVAVYVNQGFHYWQNCYFNGHWHRWTTAG
ncbi:hypothetical protein [Kitasatospora aureofaciens]|uniref:hypothetical protein n=1 Tax=Kitasatospora aureofaciens TaxID=1894 RepID=UPI003830E110